MLNLAKKYISPLDHCDYPKADDYSHLRNSFSSNDLTKPRIPCFEAEYKGEADEDRKEALEPIWIIVPTKNKNYYVWNAGWARSRNTWVFTMLCLGLCAFYLSALLKKLILLPILRLALSWLNENLPPYLPTSFYFGLLFTDLHNLHFLWTSS